VSVRTRGLATGLLLLVALAGAAGAESLAQLEQRSKAFYALLERGDRARAAAEFPDLERALAGTLADLKDQLDRMREEVTDRDGDLEALYRSPRWREPEIASLVVTYHLAWVRYQGAQLVADKARRQQLLREAAQGFTQFLLVDAVPEIYAESLYGRGLAFLDLGEIKNAIEDLEAAAADPRTAAKARAALAEARRRASGQKEPAADNPEALLVRLGDLVSAAAAGDLAAEKDATALARGLAARGGPWPGRVEQRIAASLGDGKPAGVRSSYGLWLLAQLAVDRGRCADVAPLAEASGGVHDAGRARHRPELLFLDAGCRLNAGRAREAADEFATLLREFPDAPRAREAAYYRFRALDVARTADPGLESTYEDALSTYLARWPRADGAAEARFLLAELERARGDCPRAERDYAQVGGGAFATRARLGVLECRVARLDAAPAAERTEVLAALRAFIENTPARGPDAAAAARATLLAALVAAKAKPPDSATVVALLDGFETRFPDARALAPSALELRLRARIATGDLAAAAPDLDAYLAAADGGDTTRRTLALLGRDLAGRAQGGGEMGTLATAMARKVYARLVRDRGEVADRLTLADLTLRAGDARGARRLYEAVLADAPGSLEALRGAARAADAAGDHEAALAYWRRVVDASATGGTSWYEARLAQATLLAADGRRAQACALIRGSRGRATSAGADVLEARLQAMEPEVCR
jgi:hypothetical protein